MALEPVCKKCSKPHYNFVACDKAPARVTRVTGAPLSAVLTSVPTGFKAAKGWGAGDRWDGDWNGSEAA